MRKGGAGGDGRGDGGLHSSRCPLSLLLSSVLADTFIFKLRDHGQVLSLSFLIYKMGHSPHVQNSGEPFKALSVIQLSPET